MSPWRSLFVRLVEALARIQLSLSSQIDEIMEDSPDRCLAVALQRVPVTTAVFLEVTAKFLE